MRFINGTAYGKEDRQRLGSVNRTHLDLVLVLLINSFVLVTWFQTERGIERQNRDRERPFVNFFQIIHREREEEERMIPLFT